MTVDVDVPRAKETHKEDYSAIEADERTGGEHERTTGHPDNAPAACGRLALVGDGLGSYQLMHCWKQADDAEAENMKLSDDLLDSAEAIASELGWVNGSGKPQVRRVYHLREKGCPVIRKRSGIGIYAFRSELKAWLRGSDSTPGQP